MMNKKLLDILACPLCKGALKYVPVSTELVCPFDRLAYPIKDGVPVMLAKEAREMTSDEVSAL